MIFCAAQGCIGIHVRSVPERAAGTRQLSFHVLLAGQATEVYVPGLEQRVGRYLPQTLGLEPIFYGAYHYDRDGSVNGKDELAQIARQLSAERRWIAGGGPWYWDQEFAARAEAILLFELYDRREHGRADIDMGIRHRLAMRKQAAKARKAAHKLTEEDVWRLFLDYAVPAAAKVKLTPMEYALIEVRERYLDKTFVIIDPDDRRRLRDVRPAPNSPNS